MARHGLFTKEQLAQRYGVSIDSIDHYVNLNLLQPIKLDDGVFYGSSAFLRLEIIQKGKSFGLSLLEIRRLMDGAKPPG